ncbi:permease-like cell division protein FtsX [Alkaliphilus crotonatoxidans]
MKIRTVKYIFRQGIVGLWRNRGMSIASIGSVTASLVLLGIIITLVLNINNAASMTQMQFDTIQVYLYEELSEMEMAGLKSQLEAISGVRIAEFISKEQALLDMKESWGEQGYLLEYLEENPLPNSYIIHMEQIEAADGIVEALRQFEEIEEVKYYKEIIENLLRIAGFIRTVGMVLIVTLVLVAMFIISNTIKIALNARRQEINIMKYVGATNWFIRWPFIMEGVVLGIVGAVVAIVIVYYGYQSAFDAIASRFTVLLSAYLIPIESMIKKTIVMFTVLGGGVGALGSIISLRKHLKV